MKNIRIELRWAIIFAFMTLVWMVAERLTGLHDEHIEKHAIYTNLIAIPAIAIYVFALLDKRKNFYGEFMTYKQGFMAGFILTLFIAILSPLTQWITTSYIAVDFFPNMTDYVVQKEIMLQEEAEKYFSLKSYIIQGLMGALSMGILTTAVVAFFVKREKPKSKN